MVKKILFVAYRSPVGTIWINEAFRTALGMYGEDLEPSVLLMDAAVVAFSARLNPRLVGLLPCTLAQKQLQRFETRLYAVREDIERYKVEEIDQGYAVSLVSAGELSELFHIHDSVVFM